MTKEVGQRSVQVLLLLALVTLAAGCATTGGSVEDSDSATTDPIAPETLIAGGDEAARRGDFERALAHYVRAVGQVQTVDVWIRVGAASTRLGQSERALHAYLSVIALDPVHAEAREGAGLEHLALKDFEAAREQLTQAVELDPQRWRSRNALGIIADRNGDHTEAIAHYEAALAINPGSPLLLNNLGYSRYLANDIEQAALDFYAATELDHGYKPAWSNLAMTYAQRGWYRVAVETLLEASDKATAYNDVGYIALTRNDLVEAEQLLSEAVRLSPIYYPIAHQNLEAVRAKMSRQQ
jgi:Flp pilus assembly protein TadD